LDKVIKTLGDTDDDFLKLMDRFHPDTLDSQRFIEFVNTYMTKKIA